MIKSSSEMENQLKINRHHWKKSLWVQKPWKQMPSGNTCQGLDVMETNKTFLHVGSIVLLDQTLESKNPKSKVPERDVWREKSFTWDEITFNSHAICLAKSTLEYIQNEYLLWLSKNLAIN